MRFLRQITGPDNRLLDDENTGCRPRRPADFAMTPFPGESIMRVAIIGTVLTLGFVLTWAAPAAAEQGQSMGISRVPQEIRDVADSVTSGANWLIAFKFERQAKPFYRLIGKDIGTHNLQADVTVDGHLIDVRTFVTLAEVPEAARTALNTRQPQFEPKDGSLNIAAVGPNDQEIAYYRITGAMPGKKEAMFNVSPDGTRVVDSTAADIPPKLEFQKVTCAEGSFSVEIPGKPEKKIESQSNGALMHKLNVQWRDDLVFYVCHTDFNGQIAKNRDPQEVLKAYRSGFLKGCKFVGDKEIAIGKSRIPGLEFSIVSDARYSRARLYLKDWNHLYVLLIDAPQSVVGSNGAVTHADVDRFFNSFAINNQN
jgi:hypothetical protein